LAETGVNELPRRCLEPSGFDRHLVKPIGREALKELVRAAAR
jgi:hypothetical protein